MFTCILHLGLVYQEFSSLQALPLIPQSNARLSNSGYWTVLKAFRRSKKQALSPPLASRERTSCEEKMASVQDVFFTKPVWFWWGNSGLDEIAQMRAEFEYTIECALGTTFDPVA